MMGCGENWGRIEENEKKGRDTKFVAFQLSQIRSVSLKGLLTHGNFSTMLEAIIISNRFCIMGTMLW